MKTVIKLTQTEADLLTSILRAHRSQVIKSMEKTSPIKNWLAYKMLDQDLESVENTLSQINEPVTVFY